MSGEQNAAADGRRVFEGLQARGEGLLIVVAEIGVPRAGRQDERIVGEGRTVIEPDAARFFVDGLGGGEQCRDFKGACEKDSGSARRSPTAQAGRRTAPRWSRATISGVTQPQSAKSG
jgi:hypothetical protein